MPLINDFKANINFFGIGECYQHWDFMEQGSTFSRIYFTYDGTAEFDDGHIKTKLKKNHLYIFPINKPYALKRSPEDPLNHLWAHIDIFPVLIIQKLIEIPFEKYEYIFHLIQAIHSKMNVILNMYTKDEYCIRGLPNQIRSCTIYCIPKICKNKESIDYYMDSLFVLNTLFRALIISIMSENKDNFELITDDYIKKAIEFINSNYMANIDNSAIASYVNLETKYFIKHFKKELGITPHKYLINYRLGMAEILLSINNKVNKAATEVGIDPKRFSSIYKKYRGHLPSDFLNNKHNINDDI